MFLGDSSLILRFDPNYVFDYVLNKESMHEACDQTIFRIKPLTILQNVICKNQLAKNSVESGNYSYQLVKYGLIGWENFVYIDDGEEIPFNEQNFSTLSFIDFTEIAEAIKGLTEVEESVEKQIRLSIRWSEYLHKTPNKNQWQCNECTAREIRNCDGLAPNTCRFCKKETFEEYCPNCGKLTTPKFILRLSKKHTRNSIQGVDYVTRCPVALLDNNIIEMVNAAFFATDSKCLPVGGAALEQSNYYYIVRQIINSEQAALLQEDMADSNKSSNRNKDLTKPPKGRGAARR